ncbi:MAG: hypothetical protein J0H01_00570 [Rhizobiales bacterium]|nr:hypothetical protein [Hyphomicrobiales bacterium]
MTDEILKPGEQPPAPTKPAQPAGRDPRAERLAAQLKANLKRRKAQARGRAEAGAKAEPADDQD